ncbi:non-ribosomal peptide synthetase [Bacillus pseudomycoides]|uniref:non-ribosomal peptide synthetase n=1 Tax=Bacillus pseudomycoides TaxID=64104 RepID=UPI001F0A9D5A|nr:non-ribosomal peptide synthetase [Bacillus pseudomycoides]
MKDYKNIMEWQKTKADYPLVCMHQLFENQVQKTPDQIAVVKQQESITYRELEERSNQIAQYLQRYNISKDTPIGLCMNRSINLVVVLMGILKAGGAYLPIDPDAPKARIKQILSEVQAPLCFSESELKSSLPLSLETDYIFIDEIMNILNTMSIEKVSIVMTPEQLVSVYYTSGTTGKPKCVGNIHRGYVNKINSMQRAYPLQLGETVLQKATIAFDDSSIEIFWPLAFGGTVALMEPGLHRDPREIVNALIQYKVKYMYIVSSMLSRIVDVVEENDRLKLSNLKGVFAGADPLTPSIVRRYMEKMPGILYNTWGATEVSIDATIHACSEEDRNEEDTISIGKPFDNVRVYILDEKYQPVCKGEVGDLYVSGVGVSKGYLNDHERTEQMFIDDPFFLGEKMYKTGDKGYYREDGSIKFAGRVDNQIKIRGIRIELEEIESVMRRESNVKESIVLLREDIPGVKRLVAYVVLHESKSVTTNEIKGHLKNYLPEYMCPHYIYILDRFPLNQNDKIDKQALPIPDTLRPILETDYVAPQTDLEKELTSIFSQVLNVEKIGTRDSFFDLGGDSISATQVMSMIRVSIDQDVPLKLLFELKCVSNLANYFQHNSYSIKNKESITPQSGNKQLPMSYAQERMWLLQEMDLNQAAYNEPIAFRLHGELNVKALELALNKIIARQESLRTYFVVCNEQPVQNIEDSIRLNIDFIDLSNEIEKEGTAQKVILEDAQKPFNLKIPPLLRVKIFKIKDNEWIFYLNMHHIITDGWSTVVFFEELAVLYDAYSKNKVCDLEELPVGYSDFSNWQRVWLESGVLEKQLSFWKSELSGELPVLQLPINYPRKVERTYNGDKLYFTLESDLVKKVKELTKKYEVSDYMFMMAVFNLMLHRYSGQEDILVGSPIANRHYPNLSNIIGFFVNSMIVRSHYKKDETFVSFLHKMKERCLEIYSNQDVPFEILVRELQPKRDLKHAPLVQVMFSFQNKLEENLNLQGMSVSPIQINNKTSRYELTLFLTEKSNGEYDGVFEYNTDLFNSVTIQRFIDNFKVLLKDILSNPTKEISRLEMLAEEEHQQLKMWNQTKVSFPKNKCLHELFEEQVQKTPNLSAVVFGTKELTYKELDMKANQLAQLLMKKGVGPDKVVGICIERSIELVIGLVGILKAGGAYLPLDPEAPNARLRQIISNAGCDICLSQKSLQKNLSIEEAEIIFLDSEWNDMNEVSNEKPQVAVTPEHLVSVYYTSGSTGQPKGVANIHKGWVNRINWMQNKFNLKLGETVLQKTTLTFDDSAVEFFWPLTTGGRIALMNPGMHRDPKEIINAAILYNTVHLQFVPSMLNMVLDELHLEDRKYLSSLRNCISSGEALSPKTVEKFYQKMPGNLHNTWGATEVSIDSTIYTCNFKDSQDHGAVCVGKPFDNNEVYILDEYLQPVPIGVTGDLYLAGVGLAREYLKDEEKTKKVFIQNPFVEDEKMYKTGDRGYFLQDGSIKFIGRDDNQVKIRGMRVELGEIEATLLKHFLVKDTVVVLQKETEELQRLIAYVIPSKQLSPQNLEAEEIRNYLKNELPEYMVPSFLLFLDAFPLNANGKLDRKKLPAVERQMYVHDVIFAPPETMVEKVIADIWKELLKLDDVGVDDNFFNLGGHSLLATQVVSRIRRQYKIEIPLREIFTKPTIRQLSEELEIKIIKEIENMTDEEAYELLNKNI